MTQLRELARRFPPALVERKPGRGGGDYVTHSVVNERLLEAVGPFDFNLVEVVRGTAPEYKTSSKTYAEREGAIVGVVARLTVTIDGRTVSVEEVGAEDNPAGQTDAQNLKNSMSDALKRCAMRFGLGLHLWSQEHYFLDRALAREDAPQAPAPEPVQPDPAPAPAERPAAPERTLTDDEAARLAKALVGAGTKSADHLKFAGGVVGRELEALSDLTVPESKTVFATAKGEVAA